MSGNYTKHMIVKAPIEPTNGDTYWVTCGNAFVKEDGTIAINIDRLPVKAANEYMFTFVLFEKTNKDVS